MGAPDPFETDRIREARRRSLLQKIPAGFNGIRHFACLLAMALALIAGSLWLVRGPTLWEALLCPLGFLFANFVEWAMHKYPLHYPLVPRILYKRHTLTHHVVYTHDEMGVRDWRELYLVMFPLWALPLFALIALPVPMALLGFLWSANAAGIFGATAVGYYLLYEVCHLSYHLPEDHPVSRWRLVRALKLHHQRHHDPRRMVEGNFNITFPIMDWVLGSFLDAAPDAPRPREDDASQSPPAPVS